MKRFSIIGLALGAFSVVGICYERGRLSSQPYLLLPQSLRYCIWNSDDPNGMQCMSPDYFFSR